PLSQSTLFPYTTLFRSVLPTKLPLQEFYRQLLQTQEVLNKKFMGWVALGRTLGLSLGFLARGQTNFVKMLWKFNSILTKFVWPRDRKSTRLNSSHLGIS